MTKKRNFVKKRELELMLKITWAIGANCFAHVSGHKVWPCTVSEHNSFPKIIHIFNN